MKGKRSQIRSFATIIVLFLSFLLASIIVVPPAVRAHGTDPAGGVDIVLMEMDDISNAEYSIAKIIVKFWQITGESNPTWDYYHASITVIQLDGGYDTTDMWFYHRWGRSYIWHDAPEIVDLDPPGGQVGNIDVTYTVTGGLSPSMGISWTNHIESYWTIHEGWYYTRSGDYRYMNWDWNPYQPGWDYGKLSTSTTVRVEDDMVPYYLQVRGYIQNSIWWCWWCWSYDTGYHEYQLWDNT